MTTTIFLWAALSASTLFLIIIVSPLRFGIKIRYRQPREPEYEAWASYIHPAIVTYRYSSEEGRRQTLVFGKEWAGKKRKGKDADDTNGGKDTNLADNNGHGNDGDDADRASGINNAGGVDNVNNIDDNADGVDDAGNINGAKDAGHARNAGSADNIGKSAKSAGGKKPKTSMISRIKQRIDAIKRHWLYKLAADRIFMKKFLRWLRRAAAGILKLVTLDRVRLRASVGLRDPAALGRLYGYFIAAASALELRGGKGGRVDLAMEPVFAEERMDVDCEAAGSAALSAILQYSLAMLFTFPYWRARQTIRFGRKRRRGVRPSSSTVG